MQSFITGFNKFFKGLGALTYGFSIVAVVLLTILLFASGLIWALLPLTTLLLFVAAVVGFTLMLILLPIRVVTWVTETYVNASKKD